MIDYDQKNTTILFTLLKFLAIIWLSNRSAVHCLIEIWFHTIKSDWMQLISNRLFLFGWAWPWPQHWALPLEMANKKQTWFYDFTLCLMCQTHLLIGLAVSSWVKSMSWQWRTKQSVKWHLETNSGERMKLLQSVGIAEIYLYHRAVETPDSPKKPTTSTPWSQSKLWWSAVIWLSTRLKEVLYILSGRIHIDKLNNNWVWVSWHCRFGGSVSMLANISRFVKTNLKKRQIIRVLPPHCVVTYSFFWI